MSEIPPSGAAPTTARGDALYADGKSCFVCSPPYKHLREWIPDPNHLNRPRTLVLCFDGTGDSFDQDVSRSTVLDPSQSGLSRSFTELQRRPALLDAEEGRPYETARLLSGDFHPSIHHVLFLISFSGRDWNLHRERCDWYADYPEHLQVVGRDGCLEPPFPHQRFSFPSPP